MKCLASNLKLSRLGKHRTQRPQPNKAPSWGVFSLQTVLRFVLYRLLAYLEDLIMGCCLTKIRGTAGFGRLSAVPNFAKEWVQRHYVFCRLLGP